MTAAHDPAPAVRTAGERDRLGQPRPAVEGPEVADLVAALGVARAFLTPVGAREGPANDGPGTSVLLAGLHLDLATAELADLAGSTGTDRVERARDPGDCPGMASAGAAGRVLVARCLRDLQGRLRRGPAATPGRDDPDESLSYARAVLHLHAAQRAWPAEADAGGGR